MYKRQNVYGARTITGLAVDAIGKEIPELAKYIRQFDYVAVSYTHLDVYKRQPGDRTVETYVGTCDGMVCDGIGGCARIYSCLLYTSSVSVKKFAGG